MKEKRMRQDMIVEIIKDQSVSTQDELLGYLCRKGIRYTQATLSRDIKELGVILVPSAEGHRYCLPSSPSAPVTPAGLAEKFRASVTSVRHAGNQVVVKTLPGEASGTARLIDGLNMDEVLGTIAGDDTFLIIAKSKKAVSKILNQLR